MNITVSKVYDKQRFEWFIRLKYGYPSSYVKTIVEDIDENNQYLFSNLTEVEVRYLQTICKLKMIPTKMPLKRKRNIPPYLDNERTSCIDVSPQPGDEPKQEPLDLFHVTFTKIIHYDEMLNERQIQALLKDKHVKSINIDK